MNRSSHQLDELKRKFPLISFRLEESMHRYVFIQKNTCVVLMTELIYIYSRRLLDGENSYIPNMEKITLEFLEGWVEFFKNHFKLRSRRIHGESLSASQHAINDRMHKIMLIIMTYSCKYIWNDGNFGYLWLFYRNLLSWKFWK